MSAGPVGPLMSMVPASSWQAGVMERSDIRATAQFLPFKGTRFAHGLDGRCAPPYDVLTHEQVAFWRTHPENITYVDVPLPTDGAHPYAIAGERWQHWHATGVVLTDSRPTLTVVTMTFDDARGRARSVRGVIGAVTLNAGVQAHERTTPKASTDRLDLTRATRANLSPIWALSPAAGLTDLLREVEMTSAVSLDGVQHGVGVIDDDELVAAICSLVSSRELVIADGHHRYGVAREYAAEAAPLRGVDATMMFVNELVADQLAIDAIHRVYPMMTANDVLRRLGDTANVIPLGTVDSSIIDRMDAEQSMCLIDDRGEGYLIRIAPSAIQGVRDLDGAVLEHLLGATDVRYEHDLNRILRGGLPTGSSAVLIRPVGVDEILRTATTGELMPPKSTFFTPKLATGVVIRDVGAQ